MNDYPFSSDDYGVTPFGRITLTIIKRIDIYNNVFYNKTFIFIYEYFKLL